MIRRIYLKKIFISLFLLILFVTASNESVYAEQTIISIPSSEVLPFGDMILKQSTRMEPFGEDLSTNLAPSATFGTGWGTEFSSSVATSLDSQTVVRGRFGLKKVWFLGSSTRLTAGGAVSPYFTKDGSPDSFVYTHLTQRFKKTKTSVTAGVYAHGQSQMPNMAGFLVGMEQVIIPNKLRLAMDWTSTDDNQGRFGVGLKYRPISTISITSAIIIPNRESDDIGFNLSVSKFISLKDINLKRRL